MISTQSISRNLSFQRILFDYRLYPINSTIFILTFLALFQPFDIRQTSLTVLLLSFLILGSTHALVLYIYRKVLTARVDEQNPTKVLLMLIPLVLATITIAKSIHVISGLSPFTVGDTLEWYYAGFIVLPIPHLITVLGFKKSIFTPADKKTYQGILIDQILYCKALENYVEIWFLDQGTLKRKIVRSTLSSIDHTLGAEFIRCHRSYLVNTRYSMEVKGNARTANLALQAGSVTVEVPVAPKRYQAILQHTQ